MFSRPVLAFIPLKAIFNRRMSTLPDIKEGFTYKEAIQTLNTLQSNYAVLKQSQEKIRNREDCVHLKRMWKYLKRIGIHEDDLKKLSVIHIAGTKGKGTTTAICESILRCHGFKTGMYTSPHLVMVSERIQIAGQKLSNDQFAAHFGRLYRILYNQQDSENDMPAYFMFLTIMAFDVFLKEKVDVAVVEVGIGGEYDTTNVVNNVVTTGITSLGLEHTAILGNTIEQIAREKGGIMKNECISFTVNQLPSAMNVLKNIALTRNCSLNVVPDFDSYLWEYERAPKLNSNTCAFKMNASLAIQLAHSWMSNYSNVNNASSKNIISNLKEFSLNQVEISKISNDTQVSIKNNNFENEDLINVFVNRYHCLKAIPSVTVEAISSCLWPGRCQIFRTKYADFYIDGAHTKESLEVCAEWFMENKKFTGKKILIFNLTGDRCPEPFLKYLFDFNFDLAIFTPNVAYRNKQCIDQISYVSESVLSRSNAYSQIWNAIKPTTSDGLKVNYSTTAKCVEDALDYIKKISTNREKPQVLITGSLHLVGAALTVLTSA